MKFETWQLIQYQSPALAICAKLNEDPNVPVSLHGEVVPRWLLYANRIAEAKVIAETMREYGHVV